MRRKSLALLTAILSLPPFSEAAEMPPSACEVRSLTTVTPATAGFGVSRREQSLFVLSKPVGRTMQVFIHDRRDGQERCLTCTAVPSGPAVDRNKGSASFLADGEHIVLEVEMEAHPFEGLVGKPGDGWFSDLWVTDLRGDRWWNLTHYPHGAKDRYGVLIPEGSPDGRRLMWSELFADGGRTITGATSWGQWRIRIADLTFDASGEPHLGVPQTITTPDTTWYETQSWSHDGRFVMFASDAGLTTPLGMDLWVHDLVTGENQNLTRTPQSWEEFGDFSPDGKLIAFMSSECCAYRPTDDCKTLRSELYLTTRDRAWTRRLTHFNDRDHPDAKDGPGGSIVTKLRWSEDGTRIWFERPFYDLNGRALGSWLMELSFAGACGRQL
ncbi:WD40-like Beta Propeller Repeat [Rhizobiales bacterium GAS113]|nr:WD40-like Beta Propeller Repeat [Rhizobiales bacterium GAS113]